jgi:hypothetical protein
MKRRDFLKGITGKAVVAASAAGLLSDGQLLGAAGEPLVDAATAKDWLARWEANILDSVRARYCDKEMGEGIGWRVSPYLSGFHYGYLATRDPKWVDMLVDWTDSWIKRGVEEPDGFMGWPMLDPDGPGSGLYADSLLGEAMALRPVVLLSDQILKTPALEEKWGAKARGYLELGGRLFDKWDSRGCWREVKDGGLWVFPPFGIDQQSGQWTAGYEQREAGGFSHPANKENEIAGWLLAMYDVTGKAVYRERAGSWFRLMKSRLRFREGGKYLVWNYWDPAGPWDYKSDGSPKHWVGVHPNGGYYQIDVSAMVDAFEHGLVFKPEDIDRLIATNRDFMWNQELRKARFQRIDGGQPDPRWKNSPGVLWTALAPYDETLRKIFVTNHNPATWGALSATPWFLSLRARSLEAGN